MSAYNWIVILLALGGFGLLYYCVNPVITELHDSYVSKNALVGEALTANNVIWLCWKYAPIAVLAFGIIFGYMSSQKEGGYS